jgi:MFS family permease
MNRSLIVVTISLTIWGIGEGMFLFFQPLYLQSFNANPFTIGAVLGGVGLAMMVSHIPAGYLADRIGRRPLLLAAWSLGTIATWLMALAPTLNYFVAGAVLYGFTAFVAGPLSGYITYARGHWTVIRALTLVFAFYNAGAVLGPLLGGWIGNAIGLRWSFVFAGSLFLISTVILLKIDPQPIEYQTAGLTQTRWKEFLNVRNLTFIAIIFIALFSMYISQPLSQNFLQNERNISLNSIGLLISVRSAGIVFFNLILGQINARYGFLLTQLTMALFSITIWKLDAMPWYFVGYFFAGSYQTARAMVVAQGRVLVNANNIGLAYGVFETVGGIIVAVGALLSGYLSSIDPTHPYRISLIGIGFAVILSTFFIPIKASEIN